MVCIVTSDGFNCNPGTVALSTNADAETYSWKLNGTVIGTAATVVTSDLAEGAYSLVLDKTQTGCTPCTKTATMHIGATPPPTSTPATGSNLVPVVAVIGVAVLAYFLLSKK